MTTEYKYDVFISYSRKDYVDETTKVIIPDNPLSALKDAFTKNDITFWFDEEGIYSGQTFVDIITEAIAVSKTFVFVSSKHSNRSKWTKSEILEAFDSDKTIIPFKIDDTEYDKSLKFFLRPLDFILYYENKEKAIEELIRSIKKVKDEIAEEEKRKQAEARLVIIKEKIKELIDDYHRLATQQETVLSDIVEQSRLLGTDGKQCPVCEKLSEIDAIFCDRCGWTFHPLFAIDESYSLASQKMHLSILKTQWKSISRIEEERRKLEGLTLENEQLKETIKRISVECEQHLKTITLKEVEVNSYREKCDSFSKHLKKCVEESERAKYLEKQKNDLESDITRLQNEITKQKKQLTQLKETKTQLQKDYDVALKKIMDLEVKLNEAGDKKTPEQGILDVIFKTANKQNQKEKETQTHWPREGQSTSKWIFNSKSEVFNWVKSYTSYPNSLKNSDTLDCINNISQFVEELGETYGILVTANNIRQIETIGELVTFIWHHSP